VSAAEDARALAIAVMDAWRTTCMSAVLKLTPGERRSLIALIEEHVTGLLQRDEDDGR
jgi:hypothetical protein